MSVAARSNAALCILPSPFISDLGAAISNSGEPVGGEDYLISQHVNRYDGQPFAVFDNLWPIFECIGAVWGVTHRAWGQHTDKPFDTSLARFVADRIGAVLDEPRWSVGPTTAMLAIADSADTLAGFFSVGIKPKGSGDPLALRREAKRFIHASIAGEKQ